jgi:hypothetical protein
MEPDVQDISILNDVFFPFYPDEPFFPGRWHGPRGYKIVIGDDFCPDEPPLHVRMNSSGSLGYVGSARNGPGAKFRAYGRVKGDQMQKLITDPDELV